MADRRPTSRRDQRGSGRAPRGARGGKAPEAIGRHRARRNAMMVLYQLDLMPRDSADAIAEWEQEHDFDMPSYARQLVERVWTGREAIDERLRALLHEWSLERLGAIERSILRIAASELDHEDVPYEVSLDEAVELAKRYASPEAAKLINGVLAAYVRAHRSEA